MLKHFKKQPKITPLKSISLILFLAIYGLGLSFLINTIEAEATLSTQLTSSGSTLGDLKLEPGTSIEGFKVLSSNYSPLVIRNTADTADLFRVNQNGQVTIKGGSPGAGKVLGSDANGLASWTTTVGNYDITTYGLFFINSAGSSGQVWKSDGSERGYWGTDADSASAYSSYLIDSAGANGQVWKSDGSERGYWGTDSTGSASVSCPVYSGNYELVTVQKSGKDILGCIQKTDSYTGNWHAANQFCYDLYGGRLPTVAEWHIAVNNNSLTNEIDNWEYTSNIMGSSDVIVVGNGSVTAISQSSRATARDFRCWVPLKISN
ncbi:MAG: hypothetical protein ABIE43_04570 [Patescibacteria group bacterium]